MATKRLIDSNALMEDSIWKCGGDPYDPYYMGYQDALDNVEVTIENQPTVDAVEVVRCKNCKRWNPWHDGTQGMFPCSEHVTMANHFCSHGERRKNYV